MSPFRCAGGNGMRVESWDTFRTETQRGTEAAGQACLAQRGIHKKYLVLTFLFVFIPKFGCGQNRGIRGELLPSSLHRGGRGLRLAQKEYGEPEFSKTFSVETAVKQPALSSMFPRQWMI